MAPTASGGRPALVTVTSPSMKASNVPLSRTTPAQSIRSSDRTGGSCGISRVTTAVDAMIAIVGSRNIPCQDSPSAIGPATSVPTMLPPVNSAMTIPIATCASPAVRCLRTRMKERGSTPTMTPCST